MGEMEQGERQISHEEESLDSKMGPGQQDIGEEPWEKPGGIFAKRQLYTASSPEMGTSYCTVSSP